MKDKRIVVALGRNAFGQTFPEQQKNVKKAAEAIADLVEQKFEIVITHSNGPQVGMIQTAMTEFARLDNKYTVAPMSLCGAMSQGYIGYDLQNAIRAELLKRGIFKPVSTVITQVRVDPFDKAFQHPTKVIGRLMSKEEAEAEEEKGNHVVAEGDGYRRIIASPQPIDIYEIDAIRALVNAGQLVIAAGGGGIPVMEQGTKLKGASAIIEKDYTAAKLADMIDASHLLILTSQEQMTIEDGKTPLGHLSVDQAIDLIDKGNFDPITSLPKISACVNFVSSGQNRTAIVTKLEEAYQGAKERVGTIIK
ncbi:MAG: carbamate kinase [Eubacterium sp.]|nr:carbamate kinase [Eubacterium sp.]